jgi:hypothetical protein
VGARVDLNEVQEWKVSNGATGIAHPFHIHINPFQVTEVFAPNTKLPPIKGSGNVLVRGDQVTTGLPTQHPTPFAQLAFGYQLITRDRPIGTVKSITEDSFGQATVILTEKAPSNVQGVWIEWTYVAPKYVTDPAAVLNNDAATTPRRKAAPVTSFGWGSIQELYQTIFNGFETLSMTMGERNLFVGKPSVQIFGGPGGRQPAGSMDDLNQYGVDLIGVTNLASAKQAITMILEQGEGINVKPSYLPWTHTWTIPLAENVS